MEQFVLYPTPQKLVVERTSPEGYCDDCKKCGLRTVRQKEDGTTVQANVVRPEIALGEASTLLVVGEGPGEHEDAQKRPFCGRTGAKVRPLLRKWWKGTIVLDNGTKCYPGSGEAKKEITETYLEACRPYLAQTVKDAKPDRIVAFGAAAIYALTGRNVSPLNSRRGYTWLWNDGEPVPVIFVLHPSAGLRNRFLWKFFEEDIRWALTAHIPKPKHLRPDYFASVVTTPADVAQAVQDLCGGEGFAFDCETAGHLWNPGFRILTTAAAPLGRDVVWVWDEEGMNDPARFEPFARVLEDAEVPKGGSNVKYDQHCMWWTKKVRVRGIKFDTRLERKLLDPDARGNLEDMAELVGMGEHKGEAKQALVLIERRIKEMAEKERQRRQSKQGGFDFADRVDTSARLGFDVEKYAGNPKAIAYAFMDRDKLLRYVCRDALTTARLASLYSLQLHRSPERQRIWDKVVLPGAVAIQRVEEWGVPYDVQAGSLFQQLAQQGLDGAMAQCQKYGELNPDSPQQIARLLYDQLKLDAPYKTETGQPSTEEDALLQLKSEHSLPGFILEYRHYKKLVEYVAEWEGCVRSDGRVHPSIHTDGARSGRTSCIRKGTLVDVARDVSRFPKGVPIEQVRFGDLAYCYDSGGRLVLRRVLRAWRAGRKCALVRVKWRGQGHRHEGYLDLTPEHRVRLTTGKWREAGDLQPGDRVYALARGEVDGYARLWPTGAEEISREHRFIYEQMYGKAPEHVHHINGNKLDNRPENLAGLGASEHLRLHGEQTSAEVRAARSESMQRMWREGCLSARVGSSNGRWLGLPASYVEWLLRENAWAVSKAAKAGGYDFNSFKGHVERAGFDLEELKRWNREGRREQILEGAAHARTARLSNNHEVVAVEHLTERDDVYDLTVEGEECFIAGELLVHNCSDPNLQNIPRADTEDGKRARDCFVAPHGKVLIELDYSQLELRIAALLSQDRAMADLFRSGVDFHLGTAKLICKLAWGIPPEQVTKVHRTGAKAFNFGLAYGKTDRTLARELGIPVEAAAAIRAAIFGAFINFGRWSKTALSYAKANGGCWTEWEGQRARWRPLWRIADESEEGSHAASTARNGSINSPIQGTASDFCVSSIVRLVNLIEAGKMDAEVILPIHDSIMLLCPEKTWKETAQAAREQMVSYPWATSFVPLEVDCKAGTRWGSMETVELN